MWNSIKGALIHYENVGRKSSCLTRTYRRQCRKKDRHTSGSSAEQLGPSDYDGHALWELPGRQSAGSEHASFSRGRPDGQLSARRRRRRIRDGGRTDGRELRREGTIV